MPVEDEGLDLSILAESARAREVEEEDDEDEDDEDWDVEDLLTDINEGLILIKRTKTMLDFLSDSELCKTITKRERDILVKLSDRLSEYEKSVTTSQG